MIPIDIIDLQFKNLDHAIAAYLIPTTDGPILIETGPHSTFPVLKQAIEAKGFRLEDIKHVLLTHIHLDHAGAAWAFAETGAKIYVHPFGARNIEDPNRLMASARQIYQDQMDSLWGEMKPIAKSQLVEVDHDEMLQFGDTQIKSLHTPGHAKHHIAWQLGDNIFTGDVAGVKIGNGPVQPPCPPPDINIEDWIDSIAIISRQKPKRLYLTHFSYIENPEEHLGTLHKVLMSWSEFIHDKWKEGLTNEQIIPLFQTYTTNQLKAAGLSQVEIDQYEAANPTWMSVAGLVRYWTKKSQQA
ncbi:Glyoxylase, beta-lactamase superfamily II [Reichenbachiella agariperforans]|uniref:Glyoxylase, beta-lactamase superfamily II n=1 Tax=Reichenbachiella agariperforans TaxID=156994 RepID=A0A1M6NX10_REIAG|nr:MBL fold metallo-hydrolase [Reichenbachiella agariperforans]SHK00216.1 Glyoxylase, beta-lactamase superfamily II [Reichenbachiella agariperforans]